MKMSAQFETGEVLKTIDPNTASTGERLQLAQALATLAIAESLDALANAIWSTDYRRGTNHDGEAE